MLGSLIAGAVIFAGTMATLAKIAKQQAEHKKGLQRVPVRKQSR